MITLDETQTGPQIWTTAVRFGYAGNRKVVTYAMREIWWWTEDPNDALYLKTLLR